MDLCDIRVTLRRDPLTSGRHPVAWRHVEILSSYASWARLSRHGREALLKLPGHYRRLLRSRQQWVGFAGQSFFYNPFLAAADMFFVHPGAGHGLLSRGFANIWAAVGTCGIYSTGRDRLFKKLGLEQINSVPAVFAAVLADTIYGFTLNLPGSILNYMLSGCGMTPSIIMGIKSSGFACWTSFISGALFDSFAALDSDDPQKRSRAPAWVRWAVVDRFGLQTRKRLVWICLAFSILATSAIYCFAPGGLLR